MKELSPYFFRRVVPPPEENPGVFSGPVVEEEQRFGLRDYWRVMRKHSWLIATFFFGVVLTAVLVTFFIMTPIYTAETTLLIERKTPRVVDIQQVLSEPVGLGEKNYYKTQYEILKSRNLAVQVIRELGLEKNVFFSGRGRKGLVAKASTWVKEQKWASRFFSSPLNVNGGSPFGIDSQVIDTYVDDMLAVKPIRNTRMVKIAFSTPDPQLSTRVGNAHAEAYIRQGLKRRTQTSLEAQRFLVKKLAELKERVEKSETALNRYRREKGILSLDDKENIVVGRLTDLSKSLTEAEAERIGLEAQVHLVRNRDYDSLPAVIDSTLIRTLKEQLVRLEGDYAYLLTQFKPGYPRVAQLKAQVEETRRRLAQEINRVVRGIESAYLAADAKEKGLRGEMEKQKAAALGLKDASVKYAILARDVDTNAQLYDSVLQRMKEIEVSAELPASNVFVIDRAESPLFPSKPRKMLTLFLSALVGLMGGVGLAFFLEYMDNTLKTPQEVERYLGLPNLAMVPDFLSLNGAAEKSIPNSESGIPGEELVLSRHPFSVVNEAYRTLRTAILLSQAGDSPKTILFTGAAGGEGKTTTVVNTAITFAQMGVKVLVIDADLRRPSCHKVLRWKNGLGLTNFLTGQRELEEVLKPTVVDNFSLLSGGSIPPNPSELVGSKKMHETLMSLRESYDYILIDSPPVMPVSDAVLLSTMVDGVVLVVSSQGTPKHIVKTTLSRLDYARAKILGVVLNRVNVQSSDYDDYYYHSYDHSPAEEVL